MARWLLVGLSAAVCAIALGVTLVMVLGDGPGLFLSGRLHDPIGFINGMAALFLMGAWPLVAFAERIESRVRSSAAMSLLVLLVALTVLTQTRAALPAMALTAALLVAALPGRARRASVLLAAAGRVAAVALPWLLDVYEGSKPSSAGAVRILGQSRGPGGAARVGRSRGRLVHGPEHRAPDRRPNPRAAGGRTRVGMCGGRDRRRRRGVRGGGSDRSRRRRARRVHEPRIRRRRRRQPACLGWRQPLRLLAHRGAPVRRRADPWRGRRELRQHVLHRTPDRRERDPAAQSRDAAARRARHRRRARAPRLRVRPARGFRGAVAQTRRESRGTCRHRGGRWHGWRVGSPGRGRLAAPAPRCHRNRPLRRGGCLAPPEEGREPGRGGPRPGS